MRRLLAAVLVVTLALALPASSWARNVYVFSCNDVATDQKVLGMLGASGHTATLGPEWVTWDGTQADLATYDVAVLLNSWNWGYSGDMPVAGQDAIVTFVQNGGGLVTGQWVDYLVDGGKYVTLAPILPTVYANFTYDPTGRYLQARASRILNRGMPTSFRFPLQSISGTEAELVKKTGATTFYRTGNFRLKVGVAGWRQGLGRVVSFSTHLTDTEFQNAAYRRLFLNAVRWADPDVLLAPGEHTYEIIYRTERQLGYYERHDELYWNVTGNGWRFPIDEARAACTCHRCRRMQSGWRRIPACRARPGRTTVRNWWAACRPFTTRPLVEHEGLTIVVSWPKGFVAPPGALGRLRYLARDNLPATYAALGLLALLGYYLWIWRQVGRGPPAGVIIPRYPPAEGEARSPKVSAMACFESPRRPAERSLSSALWPWS